MKGIKLQEAIAAIDGVVDDVVDDYSCQCTDEVVCLRCLWDELKEYLEGGNQ